MPEHKDGCLSMAADEYVYIRVYMNLRGKHGRKFCLAGRVEQTSPANNTCLRTRRKLQVCSRLGRWLSISVRSSLAAAGDMENCHPSLLLHGSKFIAYTSYELLLIGATSPAIRSTMVCYTNRDKAKPAGVMANQAFS